MIPIKESELFEFLDSIQDIVNEHFDNAHYLQNHFDLSYRASLPLIEKWKVERREKVETVEAEN